MSSNEKEKILNALREKVQEIKAAIKKLDSLTDRNQFDDALKLFDAILEEIYQHKLEYLNAELLGRLDKLNDAKERFDGKKGEFEALKDQVKKKTDEAFEIFQKGHIKAVSQKFSEIVDIIQKF
jgi:hypothetical protein